MIEQIVSNLIIAVCAGGCGFLLARYCYPRVEEVEKLVRVPVEVEKIVETPVEVEKIVETVVEKIVVKDITEVDPEVLAETRKLCRAAFERFPETSGEFKRAQVYRALQNVFPREPQNKDIGLAIELALR